MVVWDFFTVLVPFVIEYIIYTVILWLVDCSIAILLCLQLLVGYLLFYQLASALLLRFWSILLVGILLFGRASSEQFSPLFSIHFWFWEFLSGIFCLASVRFPGRVHPQPGIIFISASGDFSYCALGLCFC
jgi:hypothetical protein